MTFKGKLIKFGNSKGVVIPFKIVKKYGQEGFLMLKVMTKKKNVITENKPKVITKNILTEETQEDITIEPSEEAIRSSEYSETI